MMELQNVIVALLVVGCTGYAAWTLSPKALRRRVAMALLRQPKLAGVAALQKLAKAPGGCGCDGCDHAPVTGSSRPSTAAVPTVSVVRFQRPLRHTQQQR